MFSMMHSFWLAIQVLQAEGSIARQAPERVALLRYSPSGHLLACQSAGKALELFRCWHLSLPGSLCI